MINHGTEFIITKEKENSIFEFSLYKEYLKNNWVWNRSTNSCGAILFLCFLSLHSLGFLNYVL